MQEQLFCKAAPSGASCFSMSACTVCRCLLLCTGVGDRHQGLTPDRAGRGGGREGPTAPTAHGGSAEHVVTGAALNLWHEGAVTLTAVIAIPHVALCLLLLLLLHVSNRHQCKSWFLISCCLCCAACS